MHAGDQQPFAALRRQQLDRVGMREAAPVSATMPSALRSMVTSSPEICAANQKNRR